MKMNLKPALRYQFGVFLKEAASVILAFFLLIAFAFIIITVSADDGSVNFTGYGLMIFVFMFVLGIVNIRSNLRICMQFGISRRTAFFGELIVILSAAILLAIVAQIFVVIEQVLPGRNVRVSVSDIYQLMYLRGFDGALTFGHRLQSIMVNASLQLALCLVGMLFSLLLWRLNKTWTVAAVVAMVLLVNGIPLAIYKLGINVTPFFTWLIRTPYNFVLFWLILAVVFAVINWLLLRRVNVKPAKL